MAPGALKIGDRAILDREGLQAMIGALAARGYRVLGPTMRDGAIVYDDIGGVTDLPEGWTDRQEAGSYRLERRTDSALFGYVVGPQSWKRFLHPPIERLWQAKRNGDEFSVSPDTARDEHFAFIGVRSCELHAIAIQDKVFAAGDFRNTQYEARRRNTFIVAVNCGQAGGTCFCVSMGTGPKAETGFDIALTELLDGGDQRFLAEAGSTVGTELLATLAARTAEANDIAAAEAAVERARGQMGRVLDTEGLKELLQANPDHPRWNDVASRCLTCANCTMVCPTCFCTTVEDTSDLATETAERTRRWDSCFNLEFSYVHGGSVRTETKSRYRQWITHKLASWIDQFGTSGCVGCGRCIAWCPVGIDITEEAAAIRDSVAKSKESGHGRP